MHLAKKVYITYNSKWRPQEMFYSAGIYCSTVLQARSSILECTSVPSSQDYFNIVYASQS